LKIVRLQCNNAQVTKLLHLYYCIEDGCSPKSLYYYQFGYYVIIISVHSITKKYQQIKTTFKNTT